MLRLFGIDIPAHPTQEQVQAEYEDGLADPGGSPDRKPDRPAADDRSGIASRHAVLSVLTPASYDTDIHLFCLLVCRMANVSVQHGMSALRRMAMPISVASSARSFIVTGGGTIRQARLRPCREARLHRLSARRPTILMALAAQWTQSIGTAIDFLRAMFRTATETVI